MNEQRKRLSRAERQEATRQALLDAALELFVERGIEATSIEQVTASAGYTRGAFYSNFSSKDELFLATARHFFAGLFAAAGPDSDERISSDESRQRVANMRAFADDSASIFIAEMCLYGHRHPDVRQGVAELHQEQLGVSIGYLDRIVRAAGIDPAGLPVDVSVVAQLMQATLFALHLVELIDADAVKADDGAAAFTTLMMRALA